MALGRRSIIGVVATLWGMGLGLTAAGAQGDTDTIYELGEVVVSAHRELGVEGIGTVRTISAAELVARGATTLDEAIDLIPGLHIRTGGAGTPRVDIRGFRTRHVQLLLDGIPINDTYDGQFDPTTIGVEHISRIKITTGGGSVLYGPGGNGGTINIITRAGASGWGGSLSGESRQGDARRGAMTISGSTSGWRLFASGSSRMRDGYPLAGDFGATKTENGDLRDNSDLERHNLFASARYDPSERTRVGLTVNRVQGDNGAPPVTNYDKGDPFSQKAKYDRTDDLSGQGVQVVYDHTFGEGLGVRGWTYLSQLETDENRYDDSTYRTQVANGARGSQTNTQIAGTSLQVRRQVTGSAMATLGLTAESHGWEASGFRVGKSDKLSEVSDDADLRVYSAAVQYEAWPTPQLGVVAGGAYHRQDREATGEGALSALLGASYRLAENLMARASWSRKVRFPSIRQLYDVDAGNPALEAERTMHWEAGVTYEVSSQTALSAAAFLIDAQDFIEKDGNSPYANYEELRLQGIELSGQTRLGAALLKATYAYLGSEDRSPSSQREELQHRPRHQISTQATYAFAFGLTPYLSIGRVAGQYFYDAGKEPPLQKMALNDYTLVDVRLRQSLLDGHVELHGGVDNLLDVDYEQSYGLPQAGRSAYGGVRYSF